jgi:anti-sigma factor RsiW
VSGSDHDELACIELVELVNDFLEGDLDPVVARRFELHLAQCPYCVEYVDQMRCTIALTGQLSADQLDPQTKADLLAAFGRWRA